MRGATGAYAFIEPILKFQSTRPVRGATSIIRLLEAVVEFQSTRPVRGATITPIHQTKAALISIHAPRAGRDNQA